MVTASHSPPDDSSCRSTSATEVRSSLKRLEIRRMYRAGISGPVGNVPKPTLALLPDEAVVDSTHRAAGTANFGPRKLSVVYTALHGVGGDVFVRKWRGRQFERPSTVAAIRPRCPVPYRRLPKPRKSRSPWIWRWPKPRASSRHHHRQRPPTPTGALSVSGPTTIPDALRRRVRGAHRWWIIRQRPPRGRSVEGVYTQSIVSSDLLQRIAADAGLGICRHAHRLQSGSPGFRS